MAKVKEVKKIVDKTPSRSGVQISGYKFMEEYLGAVKSTTGSATYDKMFRSDPDVKRMYNVVTAPIKSGTFKYSPVDDKDESQVKQAKFKNNILFKWQDRAWIQTLGEILTHLKFGFAIFEPYAKTINDPEFGRIHVMKNIGYIKQKTIIDWDVSKGIVNRVRQQVTMGPEQGTEWIDGRKLIVFTNEQEGDNFEGVSLFRAAYGPYIRKDLYAKLDMIGLEKMAIGTPIVYINKRMQNDSEERARLIEVLTAYTSHENAYLLLDESLKDKGFEIKEGKYDNAAVNNSIKREALAILDSVLAGFLAIGTGKSGGNSQNEGQMELFLNSLLSVAEYIGVVTDVVTHEYYVLNFGEPKVKLGMKVSGIARNDAVKAMEIIRGYVQSKVIIPDDRLETVVREDLKLPLRDEATSREIDATPDFKGEQSEADKKDPKKQGKPESTTSDD